MNCIDCNGKTTVVNTAPTDDYVFRDRKCLTCGRHFKTVEDLIPEQLESAFAQAWNNKYRHKTSRAEYMRELRKKKKEK